MIIRNNGREIVETDYWRSERAARGYVYLSINAGAFRLLVPKILEKEIKEMQTAKEVIISRGPWSQGGRDDALELLFEDGSDEPYSMHIVKEQVDRMPSSSDDGREFVFSIWTEEGKEAEFVCKYREVNRLPYLKSWK